MIHGYHGLKPSEPVKDFVLKYHTHFSGGVFWINCMTSDLLVGGLEQLKMVNGQQCYHVLHTCMCMYMYMYAMYKLMHVHVYVYTSRSTHIHLYMDIHVHCTLYFTAPFSLSLSFLPLLLPPSLPLSLSFFLPLPLPLPPSPSLMHQVIPLPMEHSTDPILVVLDGMSSLPKEEEDLFHLLRSPSTHLIITSNSTEVPESLAKEVELIRGCSVLSLQPLSTVHTTQRVVHSILSLTHFTPLNREQKLLERVAELTSGCPCLISMTTALLQRCIDDAERDRDRSGKDFLDQFASKIPLVKEIATASVQQPSSRINRYTSQLISGFELPTADHFILRVLSIFGSVPIPLSIIDILHSLVVKAVQGSESPGVGAPNPVSNLLSASILRTYPSTMLSPRVVDSLSLQQDQLYHVPQLVVDAVLEQMRETDIAFIVATGYKTLLDYERRTPDLARWELHTAATLTAIIADKCSAEGWNLTVYKEAYRLLLQYQSRL